MYCPNCGQQINDNADVCIHCGVKVSGSKADNPSHIAGIASCCFPVVGLILYFIWKDEKPNSAKLVCKWMIGGVVAWVLFYIICFIFGFAGSLAGY